MTAAQGHQEDARFLHVVGVSMILASRDATHVAAAHGGQSPVHSIHLNAGTTGNTMLLLWRGNVSETDGGGIRIRGEMDLLGHNILNL